MEGAKKRLEAKEGEEGVLQGPYPEGVTRLKPLAGVFRGLRG
jgi:hypothetical protein